MNILLRAFLSYAVRSGTLEVVDGHGKLHRFGDGSPAKVRVRFASPAVERTVILNTHLRLGEKFMDGGFTVEAGSIYDFNELVLSNLEMMAPGRWIYAGNALRYLTRRLQQINTPLRARRNIHHHYDLDGRLYALFLDNDLQYSCAYFEDGDPDLEVAQLAKKRHLASKLALRPGQRVLDIGSGWGGLGLYLAERAGVEVTGVTLSDEQFAVSNRRAAERGLKNHARFLLEDYRNVKGPFDRIVSVGMFEHVGVGHYREFFRVCRELLAPDGVMVLHSIVRSDGPGVTNPWINKYIFPGGYIPALSEVVPVIEKNGMRITDVEILRLHYAETLRAWRERFLANRDQVKALYDERFCRMWEFYLAASETAFRYQGMMNFQIQIAKNQHALPMTRNYMWEAEEKLRAADERAAARGALKIAGE
jgi:cyclopropane-fatty-acyl-phospholipid synthase